LQVVTAYNNSKVIVLGDEDYKLLINILDHVGRKTPLQDEEFATQVARHMANFFKEQLNQTVK
jgi:hypothetical protein